MCTAVLSISPGGPVLLAGVRDELADRAWQPPGRHWPDYPGLAGGRDLLAGGTWLVVAPAARRAACVLNGHGHPAPAGSRRSRGVLPLRAAAGAELDRRELADFDPFHLIVAGPATALLSSWDGEQLTERALPPGLHVVVNSGLAGDLLHAGTPGPGAREPGREHEMARIAHFLPRLAAADVPVPRPGESVQAAWGSWFSLMSGDGISPGDPRALIVARDLGDGRIWGTTSVSLVALAADGVRYDFTGTPGDAAAWYPVPLDPPG